ncbi:MAG: hypothetical protein ACRD0P_11365 [Stackebrandtia sp.]
MHLDSCRELKRSLIDRTGELTSGIEVPWLGLGLSRTAGGGYSLAVRVRDTTEASGLLGTLAHEAHDEIDVKAIGEVRALTDEFDPGDLQTRRRPLVPGCSVSHPEVTAGTLGAFVVLDGAVHVLSNNHVLANSGQGTVGDEAWQPGTADGGGQDDLIGELAAFSNLSPDGPNIIDAAIARLGEGVEFDPAAYPGGPVTTVVEDLPADHRVEKLGRTTGHTRGRITAFEVDGLRITFPHGELTFDDQIEISGDGGGFSDGGDSGSLIWASAERGAVGLLFAGSQSGGPDGTGLTYANQFQSVLEEFGARLAAPA